MSRNYKFHNPEGVYFVSFAVVNWLDVFIRNEYKNIFIDSIHFCQESKGMEVFAWCIMTSHVHLVFRSAGKEKPEKILGAIKQYTSREIVNAIKENPKESRKEFLLKQFQIEADKSANVKNHKFWQHHNNPIELWSNKVIFEKINYIHYNPVEEGFVQFPEDYLYSSARDYAGDKGLIDGIIVAQ